MSEVYLVPDNWQLAIEFDQETDNDTTPTTFDPMEGFDNE